MKYTGTIEIKKGFSLKDPTMQVKKFFNHLDEEGNFITRYLEIHFTTPFDKVKKHSRVWEVEKGVTPEDFIKNNNELKNFK